MTVFFQPQEMGIGLNRGDRGLIRNTCNFVLNGPTPRIREKRPAVSYSGERVRAALVIDVYGDALRWPCVSLWRSGDLTYLIGTSCSAGLRAWFFMETR